MLNLIYICSYQILTIVINYKIIMNLPELILLGFIPLYLFRKSKLLINYYFLKINLILFFTHLINRNTGKGKKIAKYNPVLVPRLMLTIAIAA